MNYKFTQHWFKWLLKGQIVSQFDIKLSPHFFKKTLAADKCKHFSNARLFFEKIATYYLCSLGSFMRPIIAWL